MGQAERDHIQHELETAANELFAGWIRRVELLSTTTRRGWSRAS